MTSFVQYKGMIPTSYINGCTKYYIKIARGVILMRFLLILFMTYTTLLTNVKKTTVKNGRDQHF